MLAFRKPFTISVGLQPFCGPAGMAPMKSESCVVSCGEAPTVPGEPLFGMPTQPATDATAAASTKARRHRASRDRTGRERLSAMRGYLGDLGRRGERGGTQAGRGDLRLVRAERQRRADQFGPGEPG